jgi:hypothetical protein
MLRRLLPLTVALLAGAVVPASAPAADTRDNLFVFRVTGVELDGTVEAAYDDPGETASGEGAGRPARRAAFTATMRLERTFSRTAPVRRGRGGFAFFGFGAGSSSYGPDGELTVRALPVAWTGSGRWDGTGEPCDAAAREPGDRPCPPTSGTCAVRRRATGGLGGDLRLRRGRAVLELALPQPPAMGCDVARLDADDFLARATFDPVRVALDPAALRRPVARIPFALTATERGEDGPRVVTVRLRGTVTLRRAHSCRTPPAYPCHAYLLG